MSVPATINNPNVADCKYGIECHLQKCWFKHPEGRVVNKVPGECKFGVKCKRANCTFSHPEGRVVNLQSLEDKLASTILDDVNGPTIDAEEA